MLDGPLQTCYTTAVLSNFTRSQGLPSTRKAGIRTLATHVGDVRDSTFLVGLPISQPVFGRKIIPRSLREINIYGTDQATVDRCSLEEIGTSISGKSQMYMLLPPCGGNTSRILLPRALAGPISNFVMRVSQCLFGIREIYA